MVYTDTLEQTVSRESVMISYEYSLDGWGLKLGVRVVFILRKPISFKLRREKK